MQTTWKNLQTNPHLWQRYLLREQIINSIRSFFQKQNFREIETPILTPALAAESYLEIFETQLLDRNRHGQKAYLTTSPEIFLKKLLVAGIGNCFTISKSFRNTEVQSSLHNPEFTILEWYRVAADYKNIMQDTEKLLLHIYRQIFPKQSGKTLSYQGKKIDLTSPWEKLSMAEAFLEYAHLDLYKNLTDKEIKQTAKIKGYNFSAKTTWEELFNQIYLNEIEPYLGMKKPTIIFDFPSQIGALAKKKASDPRFAERFEVYIAGLEIGDCYSELTDWKEQEARFKKEIREITRLGKTVYPYDQDFIEALKIGLPKCSGLALGVDRLIMLFADVAKIQDVLFFPANELWKE